MNKKELNVLAKYDEHYTWSHPLGHCIAHKDGAVSLMISWNGVDVELMTDDEKLRIWTNYYRLLDSLDESYCLEFHLWRESDHSLAQTYIDKKKDIVRGHEFATFIREKQAAHLAQYGRTNSVALVLTKLPVSKIFQFGVKAKLRNQSKEAELLIAEATRLVRFLDGAVISSVDQYRSKIRQSFDRYAFEKQPLPPFNPQLLLTEQLINEAPQSVDGMVLMRGIYTKVLYLHIYPDANPAWFSALASISATIHISQVIRPTNTQLQITKTEREEELAEGMASRRGRYAAAKGLSDLASFQKLVTDQNLSIFRNAFIIHIHGNTAEEVKESANQITDWVETNNSGGEFKVADYIQLPWFRAGQPGQGYKSPTFRPDHTWQVADMIPAQVFKSGSKDPESIRLGEGSQLVGFNLTNESIAHSFTAAMTGAGKGVEKGATILETYPFGTDWYIAEVGQSYRWIVEAYGGTYTTIDPDKNVVNPLPPYAVADPNPDYEKGEFPLAAKLVGGTVKALAFLLNDGDITLDAHQKAAAQLTLQSLYIHIDDDREAPTMGDYFQAISNADDYLENQQQKDAAKKMAANLESFLSTTEGRLFTRQDNLILSEGITGVDLKDVMNASEDLLKFYLVFLSLRMAQLAFYRPNKARILLDEMHVFVKSFPEVVGGLISGIARMGRKDSGYIDLVTQGIAEIDCIENEVLNSMPLRTLLYRPDGHDEIARRLSMPRGAQDVWGSYPFPEKLAYRPGMRAVGEDWYNLHLTFPPELMALADTSMLPLKEEIAAQTIDPIKRIELFYAMKEANQ